MSAAMAATSTVEAAPAVIAAATVELAASAEVTTAAITVPTMKVPTAIAVAAVEVTAAVAAIETALIAAATIVAALAATVVATAIAVSATVVAAPVPGTGADEDAACEPVRAVVAVGSAGVEIRIVVAVSADWRGAVIDGSADAHAEGDALSVGVGSGEKTNNEKNRE